MHAHPLHSTTETGSIREWRITMREYWGVAVPAMAPHAWLTPMHAQPSGDTLTADYYTLTHARHILGALERYERNLCRLDSDERKRVNRHITYTHRRPVSLYVSSDQSVAVGGSRAGQSARWHRSTLVTRTRDGVTYTSDIVIEHADILTDR